MANGSFVTFGSPWRDGRDYNQLQHQERQARLARQQRAEEWVAARCAGLTFYSVESLETAMVQLHETLIGGAAKPESVLVIRQACRALFAGLVPADAFRGRITVVRGESITFASAA